MKLRLTTHAVERYIERQKPQLAFAGAKRELEALLEFAVEVERPCWFNADDAETASFIELGQDLVGAVQDRRVVTVFARRAFSPEGRKARNEYKARRRAAKRTANGGRTLRMHPREEKGEWAA